MLITFVVVSGTERRLCAAGNAAVAAANTGGVLAALARGCGLGDPRQQPRHKVVELRPLLEAVLGDDHPVRRDDQPHVAARHSGFGWFMFETHHLIMIWKRLCVELNHDM